MFFPRLRRQAKWMFLFLALVFGIGFVVFGVGTGSTGFSDALGQFPILGGGGTPGGPDADDARERIQKNPRDANAYRDLARALQLDGKRDEAILPLEHYTRLRPKDVDGLNELAGLYLSKATRLQNQAAAAQRETQSIVLGTYFLPPPDTRLGRALQPDPLTQLVGVEANERLNRVFLQMQSAYRSAQRVYSQLAVLNPNDPQIQLQIARAAEFAQNTGTAIKAYERFIKLAPDDPLVPSINEQIKLLRARQPGR